MTNQKTNRSSLLSVAQCAEERDQTHGHASNGEHPGNDREDRIHADMVAKGASAPTSVNPAGEHHDAEEREAESEDHAATVTGGTCWLALLTPDSGSYRTREWRGRARDEDEAIERAGKNPGWSVHTFGPDVNAKPAPSSDREKLADERADTIEWLVDLRVNQAAAERSIDSLLATALAAPVEVDEAKLAVAIADELETDGRIAEEWSAGKLAATARRLVEFAVKPVLRGEGR